MGGCGGGDIGAPYGYQPPAPTLGFEKWCMDQEKEDVIWAMSGDRIQASNSVEVRVTALFSPTSPQRSTEPVTCFDFYLAGEKLNDAYVCIQGGTRQEMDGVSCGRHFRDYGVKITHWAPFDYAIPLIVTAETPSLHSNVDLYNACIDADHSTYNCVRYVANVPLPYEDVLTVNGYQTFYPPDQQEIGTYLAEQWALCRARLQEMLRPEEPLPSEGHMRFIVEDGPVKVNGQDVPGFGKGLPGNNTVLFLAAQWATGLRHNLMEFLPQSLDDCVNAVLYHEGAHLAWGRHASPWPFWMPVQEGAARWLETHPPARPEPLTYFDQSVFRNETYTLTLPSDSRTPEIRTFTIEQLDSALVSMQFDDAFTPTTLKPRQMISVPGAQGSYFLIVDDPMVSATEASIRLRVIRLELHAMANELVQLDCGEDSYTVNLGVHIDGIFRQLLGVGVPDEIGDVAYRMLDQTLPIEQTYNSGACFFDRIFQIYHQQGVEESGFFAALTQSYDVYTGQSIAQQFDSDFCVLDAIQDIVDHDLGAGVLDITQFATESFGYTPEKPWCESLRVYKGTDDKFGSSILSY